MNKSKIEWCTHTWNPVTGCLHGCEYCYAKKIVHRFFKHSPAESGMGKGLTHSLDNPLYHEWYGMFSVEGCERLIYPYGFEPTFHRYRLDEPVKLEKPAKIFVVSMGDLFGNWVPNEWIQEVFKVCEAAPWHKYLFLTKSPAGYEKAKNNNNCWFGTTVTSQNDTQRISMLDWYSPNRNKFISIEPLLNQIAIDPDLIETLSWVIIGQQTNPDRPPKDEWVQSIIDQCKAAGVPVFVKNPLFEKFPIQEWPEALKCP